jgi:hypothetical protein
MTVTDMKREIDKALSPLGFVRHNATWNRRSAQFVDVIDLQVSKSPDSVTMNAGVLHSDQIHLAILRYERGDKASACELLSETLSNTSSAWRSRVKEVAERIGCN